MDYRDYAFIMKPAYHQAGSKTDQGQHCTRCQLQLVKAQETPFEPGATVLVEQHQDQDQPAMIDKSSMSERELTHHYKDVENCS